ncbi:MAG: ATP-binding protein [Lewinellaceae bacterium]|nr:ATP-binding protein [Phaeodactylibacter sp.]MCB0612376.1 ATP-binding protein [Phaeodactylibacter sp.]MCB9346727.1 ATP-binding protein [Lewinellaceae bacterium]
MIAKDSYIERKLSPIIQEKLFTGKAILLMGARQTGKTTLLKFLFSGRRDLLWLNGDDPETRLLLENVSVSRWKRLIGKQKLVIIDEAQRIKNIGLKLKLVTDELPEVQVIATGSSSFELANQINEPLTGRKWEYRIFPISFSEMVAYHGWLEEKRALPHRMVFGYYPEVIHAASNEKEILTLLTDSYLYRDVLTLEKIKKPEKLVKLLQALAYQLGQEVSYHELGQIVDLDNQTVEKYIDLLEKSYVIFRLQPLSRNLRKELKTKRKIYFYDNGVRNAVIAKLQPLELRQDKGPLWENFLLSERLKHLHYGGILANRFFWRTQDQQEIDYVEERDGFFYAYEFKWNPRKKARFSTTFTGNYPVKSAEMVTPEDFEAFLGVE